MIASNTTSRDAFPLSCHSHRLGQRVILLRLLAVTVIVTGSGTIVPLHAQGDYTPPNGLLGGGLTIQQIDNQIDDGASGIGIGPSLQLITIIGERSGLEVMASFLIGSNEEIGFTAFAADIGAVQCTGWDENGDIYFSAGASGVLGGNSDNTSISLASGYAAVRADHRTAEHTTLFVRAVARVYLTGEPGVSGTIGFSTRW